MTCAVRDAERVPLPDEYKTNQSFALRKMLMSDQTPASPTKVRALNAYPAVALVYLTVFGAGAVTWIALLLSSYHIFPATWLSAILRHQEGSDVLPAVYAFLGALLVSADFMTFRRDKRPSRFDTPKRRAAALAVLAMGVLPALWALGHVQRLESDDLAPRIVQLVGAAAMAGVFAVDMGAPDVAELGIEPGTRRSITEAYAVMRTSLVGLVGSFVAAYLIFWMLKPPALVGPVGAASGVPEAWWFWIIVSFVNAIVEEGICTAWLYALLHRAGRPRYEIYAVAAAARIAFHLYMGLPGLGAAIFALVNIRLFERTRRIVPLVLTHALFDCATITGNPTLLHVFVGVGVLMLLYPPSYLPRRRSTKQQELVPAPQLDAGLGSHPHPVQVTSLLSTDSRDRFPENFGGRIVLNTSPETGQTTELDLGIGHGPADIPAQRPGASDDTAVRRPL